MTRYWFGSVWTVFMIIFIGIAQTQDANLRCSVLKNVFPSCPCRSADEEKGSVYAIVDCSNKELTGVPTMQEAYSESIYKLILKGNKIESLTDNSFQGLKVEYLDLSGNSLSSVENDTFLSMSNSLRKLEIDGDSSSKPPINALKKLNILEELTLRKYNVPFMEESYFLSFTKLKSLTLDDWKTEHMEIDSLLGLENLRSMAILNQQLTSLPLEPFTHDPLGQLETLTISSTQITTVSDSIFQKLTNLKNLDLSNNKIDTLEENCFSGVEDTLQNINLHGNLLNNDNAEKLKGLSGLMSLNKLDLSYNTFKKIPSMLTLNPTKPFDLLLNDNEINEVQEKAFSSYAQYLRSIDLSQNEIRAMDPRSFSGVTKLISFHMSNPTGPSSDPIVIPNSLVDSASTLQTLYVTGHKVDPNTLWPVISKLRSLKELNIKSAELKSIPDFTFQNLNTLEQLDLSYNTLSVLTQKSLVGLRKIATLDLEGNDINTIPSCLFYGFTSPEITLNLGSNPIICDCKIKQLLTDVKKGFIKFDSTSLPRCNDDGILVHLKNPSDLVCNTPFEEETCTNYYTTQTPTTGGPVKIPQIEINVLEVGTDKIKASWTITENSNVDKFKFQVTSSDKVPEFTRDNLPTTTKSMEATGLPSDTNIVVCVTATFLDRGPIQKCVLSKTKKTDDNSNSSSVGGDDSDDTGIIVGCIVAGVALIGVVVAIIILLVVRKRPKKLQDNNDGTPMPPRHFGKAELPTMADDTRRFKKIEKNGKGPHQEGMQVVAISDGQTSPGGRVGRANMMFEPEDGYEPMENFKKKSNGGSLYENDHGALPPTPGQNSLPPSYPGSGYYNQAFRDDKYDQMEVEL